MRSPQPERFGWTPIDPDGTIGALALNVLRRHFETFLAREPGTRLGDDVEELHDMRVASRRLRAALSLFGDVLAPAVLNLREELQWIGGVLGAVRDLDVQLEELEEWQATRSPNRTASRCSRSGRCSRSSAPSRAPSCSRLSTRGVTSRSSTASAAHCVRVRGADQGRGRSARARLRRT